MDKQQLSCCYAAMILADDDVDITSDKISTLIKAADVKDVPPFLPAMFANAISGKSAKELFMNLGTPGAGAAPAETVTTAGGAPANEDKKAEKKKEPEPESEDDDMGMDLFG